MGANVGQEDICCYSYPPGGLAAILRMRPKCVRCRRGSARTRPSRSWRNGFSGFVSASERALAFVELFLVVSAY